MFGTQPGDITKSRLGLSRIPSAAANAPQSLPTPRTSNSNLPSAPHTGAPPSPTLTAASAASSISSLADLPSPGAVVYSNEDSERATARRLSSLSASSSTTTPTCTSKPPTFPSSKHRGSSSRSQQNSSIPLLSPASHAKAAASASSMQRLGVPFLLPDGNGFSTLRPAQDVAANLGSHAKSHSNILVAVRMRPLSDKEKLRGDKEVWAIDSRRNIGLLSKEGKFVPKHRFDTVFGAAATNREVYETVCQPFVQPALSGVNGTVFAYGVTSSGKTHTIMGTSGQPGLVPSIIRDVFEEVSKQDGRSFVIRLSMMEIYNEVLNDLLDPSRTNLKLWEDGSKGVLVEGLSEEVVASAEQALACIVRGETYRKVSCTAYNEDSSRSHTICRIHIDGTEQAMDGTPVRRTYSVLNLIDLAGSESAKVSLSKGQRMEGSYINKSLLTLGTVIHKLADGHTGHIPFRDSKLTRLLQNSLSGPGARVAIVCNITPAAAQVEETANTLKFATRAKLVCVAVSRNETMDERALLKRYQHENAELKRQVMLLLAQNSLPRTPRSADGHASVGDAASELQSLRQKLDIERQARLRLEQEKALLEVRLRGLTRLLLSSNQALVTSPRQQHEQEGVAAKAADVQLPLSADRHSGPSPGARGLQRDNSFEALRMSRSESGIPLGLPQYEPSSTIFSPSHASPRFPTTAASLYSDLDTPTEPGPLAAAVYDGLGLASVAGAAVGAHHRPVGWQRWVHTLDSEEAVAAAAEGPSPIASIHSAGDLHMGSAMSLYEEDSDMDTEAIITTIRALHDELNEQDPAQQLQQQQQLLLLQPSRRLKTGASCNSLQSTPRGGPASVVEDEGTGGKENGHAITAASSTLGDADKDLEIQVLLADREVLQDQIVSTELANERLVMDNEAHKLEIQRLRLEHEKTRRVVRELESDMLELRRFKLGMNVELERLRTENAQLMQAAAATASGPSGAAAMALIDAHHSNGLTSGAVRTCASQLQLPSPMALGQLMLPPGSPVGGVAGATAASRLGLMVPPGFGAMDSSGVIRHSVSSDGGSGMSVRSLPGFSMSGFAELQNSSAPDVSQRLKTLELQVTAAVSTAVQRNRALEEQLQQLQLQNQQLQGLHIEVLSPEERGSLAAKVLAAAQRFADAVHVSTSAAQG